MTRLQLTVAVLFCAGAAMAVGGLLAPSHREVFGALLMIGAYPVYCLGQIIRRNH